MFPFCVNNSSDPEDVKEAIHALRRMIRYGKLADKALQQIQTVGHYDGRVPCTEQKARGYGHPGIQYQKFPAYKSISRDQIIGYKDFKISLSEKRDTGNPNIEFDVYFEGFYTHFDDEAMKFVTKHTNDKDYLNLVGKLRVCSNYLSFRASYSTKLPAVKIFNNCNLPGANAAMLSFASAVSYAVFLGIQWLTNVPQQTIDLHKNLPAWLIEDGFCRKWFREIRDHVAVASVMET
jgi:hypothetical protein